MYAAVGLEFVNKCIVPLVSTLFDNAFKNYLILIKMVYFFSDLRKFNHVKFLLPKLCFYVYIVEVKKGKVKTHYALKI